MGEPGEMHDRILVVGLFIRQSSNKLCDAGIQRNYRARTGVGCFGEQVGVEH